MAVRARAAGCGVQPVRRTARVGTSAAADVGFRTKESGRRVVRRVPAGASRPPASGAPALPTGSRAESRAARRAARSARP